MRFDATDIQAIMERVEKVESQNRGLKISGFMVLVVAVIALAASVLSLWRLGKRPYPPDQITSATVEANTVTAHEFVLAGQNNGGKPIALLMNGAKADEHLDMPVLEFYGPEPLAPEGRVLRMTLGAIPDPAVSVYPAFGPSKAGLDELPSLTFNGNEPRLFIFSGKGTICRR